jgi:hypothetical protein
MNRDEFIEMLVKLARIRFDLPTTELEELKTLLQMMPDREPVTLTTPSPAPYTPIDPWPRPFDNFPVAYGPAVDDDMFKKTTGGDFFKNWNTNTTADNIKDIMESFKNFVKQDTDNETGDKNSDEHKG